MKENDQFILDIKRLGINGEGIGFYNKLAIFVENAIPDEGHEIVITKCENKMAFGKSVNIKTVSKNRKEPECPYYENCGGCAVMHIDYNAMLKYKRDLILTALNRYTRLDTRSFEIKPTVASKEIFGYRNKSQLPVKKVADKTTVCMIKSNSTQMIPIEDCKVTNPIINRLNQEIMSIVEELGISLYLPKYSRGVLRYLVIRVNKKGEALVCFVCNEKNKKIQELGKRVKNLPNVVSVYENFNDSKKQGTIFGATTNHLEGEAFIVETLGNIKYKLYPTTFFQLNSYQAEEMCNLIMKRCKLSLKERILDAYCGVGTIGLYLAKMAKEVVGIEYNKDSILAANENAKLNNIKNAKFLQGDATQLLPKMVKEGEAFDIVVCDPPRTGLGQDFMQALLDTEVKRIVYVSCNPSTLAKDLEILSEKYKVNSITPLDMFPQTPLVESITILVLKDK